MKTLRIALAGNPNAGKTTLFNALTGDNQHVGNWPGKTVEQLTGHFDHQDCRIEIVDLPGTYSLSTYTPEEEIARNYLVQEKPDLVVNVVDASHFERNLYLTLQVLEIGMPTLILLNMSDLATRHGQTIDTAKLSSLLQDVPVLQAAAHKHTGLDKLKDAIIEFAN